MAVGILRHEGRIYSKVRNLSSALSGVGGVIK